MIPNTIRELGQAIKVVFPFKEVMAFTIFGTGIVLIMKGKAEVGYSLAIAIVAYYFGNHIIRANGKRKS